MIKNLLIILVLICSVNVMAQNLTRFIEVTGTQQLNVEADQIVLSIRVKTINDLLEKSKNKNCELVNKILVRLKKFSQKEKDIELDPISFGINYKHGDRERIKDGYYTSQQIVYTLNDLGKYYDLIDYLVKSENVEITRSFYNNSNYEKHNRLAYENAVAAAREKAEYLAKKANIKLGGVLELEDNSDKNTFIRQSYPNPFNTATTRSRSSQISGSLNINRSVRMKFEVIK